MYCSKCGKQLSENDMFCPMCGRKIVLQKQGSQVFDTSDSNQSINRPNSSNETACIMLNRDKSYVGKLVKLNVVIDGKKVGAIANGKEFMYKTIPGKHTIQLTQSWSWSKSDVLDINAAENTTIKLVCGFNSVKGQIAAQAAGGLLGAAIYQGLKKKPDIYIHIIT